MGALSRKEIDEIYDSVIREKANAVNNAPAPPKGIEDSTLSPWVTLTPSVKNERKPPIRGMENAKAFGRQALEEAKAAVAEERKDRIPKLEAPRSDYAGYAREEIQAEKDLSDYVAQEKQQMYYQNRSRNAQRKGEVPILGSRLAANGQEDITDAGKAEIASLTKQREKLQKEIRTFTTGDAGVDEANQSQTREKINEINGQIEKIKQDKHASTEDWLVPRDEYERLMRDPEFAKDIENLWKSDTSGMGGAYNAAAVSQSLNGMNVRQYYKHLEEKYGLSKKELKDIAKTAEYDAKNNAVEEYNEDVQEYGAAHPVVGSGLSLAATVPNAVEGALNVGAGLLTNDNRNISRLLDTTKTGLREGVKENTGDVGDVVYDVGMGLGDMVVGGLTGNAPAVLAGNTANQATLSALDRGQNARQAALYGGASGVADYFYNKVGLDKARELGMSAVKSSGVKSILAKMGVAAGTEAGENVLQDITQSFLDEFINKENSELQTAYAEKVASGMTAEQAFKSTAADYAVQLLESGATGAVMGAGMYGAGAGKSLVEGGLLKRFADRNSKKTWNNVEEYEKAQALDAEEMARQNEIDAEEVAERQNQAAEEIQALTEQLPEISLEPEDIERLNAGTDEGPRNEVVRETEEVPTIQPQASERPELDDAERALFEELAAGYDGSQDYWHDVVMRAQEYALENNDVQRASRVLGELDRLSKESEELMELGGKPVWSMPDPARQLDGVADRINEVLNRVPLDDEKIALEADNIRNAIDNYKAALSGDDYDAVDRARKDLNNACKRFNTRANKIGLKGYDGTFGSKSFTYDIPETLGTGSPQRLWADIDRQAKRNNALLSGEPTGDDFLVNLLLGENADESASGELPKAADVQTENAPETARVSLENTGISPDENVYRITSEDVNPPVPESPVENGNGSPDMGQRRTYTNTGVKSGRVGANELESDPILQSDAQYVIRHNADVSAEATERVKNNPEMYREQYASGTKEIKEDTDVDTAMMLLDDDSMPDWTRYAILRNLAQHGTKAGQFIQAFSKWANTAIGSLAKAAKVDADITEAWESRNRNVSKANGELSRKLKEAIDNITDYSTRTPGDPKALPIIRQEVQNTIDAYKKTWINEMDRTNMVMGDYQWLEFTPEDIDYLANMIDHGATVENLKDALNTKLATGRFGITAETQNQVNRLFQYAKQFDENSRDFVEAQAEALRLLAEEVAPKASGIEKFDTWRYMAMLGNPKTMLRNFVGNKLFSAVTGVSNNLAAAMEHGVDAVYNWRTGEHIQRTKEFLNPIKDSALIEKAAQDAYNSRYRQVEGSKYEKIDQNSLKRSRSVWNSDVMRLAEKAVDAGISDTKAVVKKYSTSLAGYMKANGLDASAIDDAYRFAELQRDSRVRLLSAEESAEMESLRSVAGQMEKARDYALKQAEYATFHEDNAFADALTKASNYTRNSQHGAVKALGYALEGVVPFKKTPANILRSAFEYSPFGALKSIKDTGKLIYENTGKRKGNLADEYAKTNRRGEVKTDKNEKPIMAQKSLAADVIDSWSKTLTGSLMTAFGYYLFSKGIITSSEKGEKYQDQLEGKGNYAININGHTYTLDWAAPGVMPLLLGAEVKKVMEANGQTGESWYKNIDQWMSTINALLDPMLETSMLSGVKDTLQTAANEVRFNEDGALGGILGAIAGNTVTGYLTQAIPTLSGQIARTVDPVRRTTDTKAESAVVSAAEKQGRKILNKLPFLSRLNPEYRDAYGRRQLNGPADYTKGDPLGNIRAFENNLTYQMLSPGYLSEVNTTDADRLGRQIFDSLDDNGKPIKDEKVFADWRSTKKINGVKLDPKQMQNFREVMGETNYALRDSLVRADWLKELPATQQNDIVKSLNSIADKIGQYSVMPDSVDVSGKLKTYLDAGGGDAGIQALVDELEAENNPYGLTKDIYSQMKADGEDFSRFVGYAQALEEAGLKDNKSNREAWLESPDVLKEKGEYTKTFKDAGAEDVYTSESAQAAYADNDVPKYLEYRKYLKDVGQDDSLKRWEEYKETGTVDGLTEETADLNSTLDWGSLGMKDSVYTTKDYERAKSKIPSLQPEEYATTFKEIDKMQKKNDSISQKEVIAYLNKIGASSSEGTKIWNAYLSNPTESSIPKLNDKGKWFIKKVK